ncbi:MAG: sarcosine oxidase subunit delta [Rhizobiaceae bacterium]
MRISCPFCGDRELAEFACLGDAAPSRPAVASDAIESPEAAAAFHDYVYLRDNPAGDMREYWYHGGGCRSWLVVERNTLTHAIRSVRAAPGAGASTATGQV